MKWRAVLKPWYLVVAVVSGFGTWGYMQTMPPAHMLSVTENDGLADAGGTILALYHNMRTKPCRNMTSRWLYNPDAEVNGKRKPLWVFLFMSPSPPTANGDLQYSLLIPVPTYTPAGHYQFIVTSDYYCGVEANLDPPSVQTKPTDVEVRRVTPESAPQVVVTPPGGSVTVVPGTKP